MSRNPLFFRCLTLIPFLFGLGHSAMAGSATWNATPVDNKWTNPANWTPTTVPNSATDVATFATTAIPNVTIPTDITVGQIVFNPGASAYTFTVGPSSPTAYFDIVGVGVTNNSGITQHFQTSDPGFSGNGILLFAGAANAGDNVSYTVQFSYLYFYDTSSLGNATVTVNAGAFADYGSNLFFEDNATAGTGTIVLNGATVPGAFGANFFMEENCNLGSAHLTVYGGTNGERGATVEVFGKPRGGTAQVEVYGNASLDLTYHTNDVRVFSIGSLVGDGIVRGLLGVGAGNQDSGYSGFGATGFYQNGRGTLNLHMPPLNNNTFYEVKKGTIQITDPDAVGGGASGTAYMETGRLTGNGTLNGDAYLGDALGTADSVLAPGVGRKDVAIFSIVGLLSLNSDCVYECNLDARKVRADKIVVGGGVTLLAGATFSLIPVGGGTIPVGTVFTVIDNTAGAQISGTFANLAEGAIVNAAGVNLQASYHGGTGNDLTLTVIP